MPVKQQNPLTKILWRVEGFGVMIDFLLYLYLVIIDLFHSEQVDAVDKELTDARHVHLILSHF